MCYVKILVLLTKPQLKSHCLHWNDNMFCQSHTQTAAAPVSEFLFAEEHWKLLLRKRRNQGCYFVTVVLKKLDEIDSFAHPFKIILKLLIRLDSKTKA